MLRSLMSTLSKSKPTAFRKEIHIYIQSRNKIEVYDIDTFNTAFNTETYRHIKSIEASARYTYASDKPSANPNPHKNK